MFMVWIAVRVLQCVFNFKIINSYTLNMYIFVCKFNLKKSGLKITLAADKRIDWEARQEYLGLLELL